LIAGVPVQDSPSRARASEAQAAAFEPGTILLRVDGQGISPLELTSESFRQLPRATVAAKAHDGKDSRYEGVALAEILRKAGVPMGKELRGKAVAFYLVVEAADGYRAVFALPEIDPEFSDRVILLADRRDGQPLSAMEGPLQIVVPGEKRHSQWVRQVTALQIGKA
jgi:DMSO/TMAO reductase YedYZ molybdopterin-dependent catalytic subunit